MINITKLKTYLTKKEGIVAGLSLLLIGLPLLIIANSNQQNLNSQAAGTASIEAENGTLAGSVAVVNDVNASGGNYVKLGTLIVPTPTPTSTSGTGVPAYGWQITTANTGLARLGLSCSSLPVYTGSYKPASGANISGVRFTQGLDLSNGNITIDRSCFQPTSVGQGLPVVTTTNNNVCGANGCAPPPALVTISNSEFDGTRLPSDQARAQTIGFLGIANLQNNYVHDFGSGLALFNTGTSLNSVVEGNYVRGLIAWGDPRTTGNHSDGFTIRDFSAASTPGRNAIIRGNRINCDSANASGAFFIQTYVGNIDNVTISNNLLEGNSYQLVLGAGFGHAYSNMRAINNRMSGTGYGPGYVADPPGWALQSENYINDPSQPENKGRAVTFN